MLLSPSFYRTFEQYEYILIHQLDSLVFSNRLLEWCTRELDFVGAPGLFVNWPRANEIRNGGLSLRRTKAFLAVLESPQPWMTPDEYWRRYWSHRSFPVRALNLPRRYAKEFHRFNGVRWETSRWERGTNTSRTLGSNEDFFWSMEATRYQPDFTVAPADVALRFAFEANPQICYERTGHRLPFGCHGWTRYDRPFWETHLLQAA